MSNLIDRLNQFIDYKGVTISKFEKSVGMSNASLAKTLKNGKRIGTDSLEKILNTYPEMNLNWLVTGDGTMLKNRNSNNDNKETVNSLVSENFVSYNKARPVKNLKESNNIFVLDTKAAAGMPKHIDDSAWYAQLPTMRIPTLRQDEGNYICMQLSGNSMEPTFSDGDWVVGSLVYDTKELRSNDVCLVVTPDGVMCKRINVKKNNPDFIELLSDNLEHKPFIIESKNCLKIFKHECHLKFNADKPNDYIKHFDKLEKRLEALERKII